MPNDKLAAPKRYGLLKGQIEIPDDFDAPLPTDELGFLLPASVGSELGDVSEAEVRELIRQTMGEGPRVDEWLRTPMPFLGGQTPECALREARGRVKLKEALLAMQHGFPA